MLVSFGNFYLRSLMLKLLYYRLWTCQCPGHKQPHCEATRNTWLPLMLAQM